MNRFLLTLLALLTGLVTPVASSQAAVRTKGEAEISAFVAASAAAQRSGHVAVRAFALARPDRVATEGRPVVPSQAEVVAPAVYTGIDRAHE